MKVHRHCIDLGYNDNTANKPPHPTNLCTNYSTLLLFHLPADKNIIEWQNTLGIKSEHWLCLFDNLLPFQLGIDCLFTIQNHTIPCNSVNDWLSVCTRQQLVVRRIRCVCSPIRKIEREILNTYIYSKYRLKSWKNLMISFQPTGHCISCVCRPITRIRATTKNQSWHCSEGFASQKLTAILEQIQPRNGYSQKI